MEKLKKQNQVFKVLNKKSLGDWLNKKFFGTDGIRGTVNESYLTADTALKLGIAAGKVFTRGPHIHRVVIGKDTRVSGYMLETALTSGFTSVGMDVFLFGPIPTPAVAFLTQALTFQFLVLFHQRVCIHLAQII